MPRRHHSTTTGNDQRARITVDLDTATREMLDDLLLQAKDQGKNVSISHIIRCCIKASHRAGIETLLAYWHAGYR